MGSSMRHDCPFIAGTLLLEHMEETGLLQCQWLVELFEETVVACTTFDQETQQESCVRNSTRPPKSCPNCRNLSNVHFGGPKCSLLLEGCELPGGGLDPSIQLRVNSAQGTWTQKVNFLGMTHGPAQGKRSKRQSTFWGHNSWTKKGKLSKVKRSIRIGQVIKTWRQSGVPDS